MDNIVVIKLTSFLGKTSPLSHGNVETWSYVPPPHPTLHGGRGGGMTDCKKKPLIFKFQKKKKKKKSSLVKQALRLKKVR